MTEQGVGVVRPLPGDGLIAHVGGLLLVCDAADAVAEELLAAAEETAAAGGDGRALARRVAQVLARSMTAEPIACAVAGRTGAGLAVLVSGDAQASIRGTGVDLRLDGKDALTWTDRLVTAPVDTIELRLPGAGEPDRRARLDAGVIPGGGVACEAGAEGVPARPAAPRPAHAAAHAGSPEPAPSGALSAALTPERPPAPVEVPPPGPAPAAEPYDLGPARAAEPYDLGPAPAESYDPGPARAAEPYDLGPAASADQGRPAGGFDPHSSGPAPFPAGEGTGEQAGTAGSLLDPTEVGQAPEPPSRPMVYGVDCPNDHFNDPRVPYCAVCGTALAQHALVPYKGERPRLGALLLDDGMALPLDGDYLLGRDPERAPEVTAGEARPARVTSPDGSVSRRHLRVRLDGWDVNLIDLGSVNGTQVQPPGDPNFYDIPPQEPVPILPGTTVRIGVSRTMRYEAGRDT
ncbi:hypothetical protein Sru01_31410 [Sphaerisporangium rufum]|uniref:FHA domain-containing protein n=1 Tax=Sphaerisporangium rufum TaxID=1381558 RepID=A0A919R1S4_9ACTN|nr:FHA domain-containing protein [Sphaerisporangium rufum]GII78159.1 hypothetical protein Sru01_31410 [Sphaerisporangium rufum]